MSSIDLVNKHIIWTDNDGLGLCDEWVKRLKARGYTLEDKRNRSKSGAPAAEGEYPASTPE